MAVLDLLHGDCRAVMAGLPAASVDAVVCDPPYHLTSIVKRFGKEGSAPAQFGTDGAYARASRGFMGKEWDGGDIAFSTEVWEAALRVAKPGAHLLAFGGTRTFHRMAVAIEDAGWEIRDTVMWVYGSGFPKSHDVSKAIDKAAGAEREVVGGYMHGGTRQGGIKGKDMGQVWHSETSPSTPAACQWSGWGTALKPAWEPIIVARKPLIGTVAANVEKHGTGALNIDGCRVDADSRPNRERHKDEALDATRNTFGTGLNGSRAAGETSLGRWPANLIHDGSDEVTALFPNVKAGTAVRHNSGGNTFGGDNAKPPMDDMGYADTGSAARFFYCAKASKADRDEGLDEFEDKENAHSTYGIHSDEGIIHNNRNPENRTRAQKNHHPTVKPTALMRYLCKLVTPPAGTVLDPFMGSGSTGKAARMDGFGFIGIEQDAEYIAIARARIAHAVQSPAQQPLHI